MRFFITMVLTSLLLTSYAFAGPNYAGSKTYDGYIAKVDKNRINLEVRNSSDQVYRVSAYVDNDTTVTLDGKAARLRDLGPECMS